MVDLIACDLRLPVFSFFKAKTPPNIDWNKTWSFSQFEDKEIQCEPINLSQVNYFSQLKMILFDIQGAFTFQ